MKVRAVIILLVLSALTARAQQSKILLAKINGSSNVLVYISKTLVLIFLFLSTHLLCDAQQTNNLRDIKSLQNEVRTSRTDTGRINLLIRIGYIYANNANRGQLYLDSSYCYYKLASDLGNKLPGDSWSNQAMDGLAFYYFASGDNDRAAKIERDLIKLYSRKKDLVNEAKAWQHAGDYSPDFTSAHNCYQQAQRLFKKANDKIAEIGVLNKLGIILQNANKLDSADNVLNEAVRRYRNIGYLKNIHCTYDILAGVATTRGRMDDELFYRIAAVKSMEATRDFQYAPVYYLALATAYKKAHDYKRCLYYAQKSFNCGNTPSTYAALSFVLGSLRELKRTPEALAFLQKAIKQYPVTRPGEEDIALVSFAHTYLALKDYKKAEEYYLLSLKLYNKTRSKDIRDTSDYVDHYVTLLRFFVDTRQFKKAAYYLKAIPAKFDKSVRPQSLAWLNYVRFNVYQASGNYVSAIQQLHSYYKLNDSLYRATTGRAAQLTQDKYDVERRDQSIKVLESNQRTERTIAQKAVLQRNETLAAIIVVLILTGIAYNGYRRKKLSELLITQKNNQLQILLDDKEQSNLLIGKKNSQLQILLSEKEWLLKEIHHRVKNNLHTVFCLLESQSKYLADDALKAIEVSQHRIYAMSLIHQKLYQSEDIKTVDMSVYLLEFIGYLSDSFDTGRYIRFDTDIEPITLDVVHAIPVALIINEAVTNAIKYAFPGGEAGVVTISFRSDNQELTLTIADNGIGIDPAINQQELNSLGLILMSGLTEDLNGVFTIKNEHGTRVDIVFPAKVDLLAELL